MKILMMMMVAMAMTSTVITAKMVAMDHQANQDQILITEPTVEAEEWYFGAQASETPPTSPKPDPAQVVAEAGILSLRPGIEQEWATELSELIAYHAPLNNLEIEVVVAVIFHESSFNPDATGIALYDEDGNYVGRCRGLMQLHDMHGIANVYDPAINVEHGCRKLRAYIDQRDGDLRRGLHRWGLTDKQARKVIATYENLKGDDECITVSN